jgi:hypothetical protein
LTEQSLALIRLGHVTVGRQVVGDRGCGRCRESDVVQVAKRVPHIAGVSHRRSVRGDVGLRNRDLGLTTVGLRMGVGLTQEVGKERKLGAGNLRGRIGEDIGSILGKEPALDVGDSSGWRLGEAPRLRVDGAPAWGAGEIRLSDYGLSGMQTTRTVGIAVRRLCGAAGSPRVAVRRSWNQTLVFGHQISQINWCCEGGDPSTTLRTALDAA